MGMGGQREFRNISDIGVQLLTASELSCLLVGDQKLRDNLVEAYYKQIHAYSWDPQSKSEGEKLFSILCDIKYASSTPLKCLAPLLFR